MTQRGSGILLHLISLPSKYGIGDMGPGARRFADFLSDSGQSFWQVLPLSPTDPGRGNIPYTSASAFAGNPLLISPELLAAEGLLAEEDVQDAPDFPPGRIDYYAVIDFKEDLFKKAFERFKNKKDRQDYESFCAGSEHWLEDYALFMAIKTHYDGAPWFRWPGEIRNRQPRAVDRLRDELSEKIEEEKFLQYLFFHQWGLLREYCSGRGIKIIGDMPIYVDYDSVDVWVNPGIFKLDEKGEPLFVSGVPPDYFSETGQLWGNPVYNWDVLKERRYAWWIRRFDRNFSLYDMLRVDHFRGLVAYWEVGAGEKTAVNGEWIKVPTGDFFEVLLEHFEEFPVIAEDLGIITDDVREVISRCNFPGMKVLLFAFGSDLPTNPYAPHNHIRNCVVYPGTHDNNTVRGWFENEAGEKERLRFFRYIGREVAAEEVSWEFIRLAMMSVADRVIFSMQDILGLGEESRMNRPATVEGNYRWRMTSEQLSDSLAGKLLDMTKIYGRTSLSGD